MLRPPGGRRLHLLAQQAHEVVGCVGVQAKGGHHHVGGSVGPVLVVVLHPAEHGVGHGGLGVDHLTWGERHSEGQRERLS